VGNISTNGYLLVGIVVGVALAIQRIIAFFIDRASARYKAVVHQPNLNKSEVSQLIKYPMYILSNITIKCIEVFAVSFLIHFYIVIHIFT